jgi:uncharacterized protein (DUF736 family)
MANIGTFTTTKNGFAGQINTLALNIKARFERVENPSDNGPQFRIFSGNVELGAGWQKQAKGNRTRLCLGQAGRPELRGTDLRHLGRGGRPRRNAADLVAPEHKPRLISL